MLKWLFREVSIRLFMGLLMAVFATTKTEIALTGQLASFEMGADQILANANPSGFDSLSESPNLITHDDGTMDEYDSVVGAKAAASVISQHDGDFGMEVTLTDTVASYQVVSFNGSLANISFWFNPNGYTTTDSGKTDIVQLYSLGGGTRAWWMYVTKIGADYKIGTGHLTDALAEVDNGSTVITDDFHLIELYTNDASAGGANDGIVRVFIDGAETTNVTNIDNDTKSYNQIRIGLAATTAASLGGSYYIDTILYSNVAAPPFSATEAAMVEQYGWRVSLIDSKAHFGRLSDPSNETSIEYGFLFDPNSLTMATNDEFSMVIAAQDDNTNSFTLILKKTASDYVVYAVEGAGIGTTSEYDIVDGENRIKLIWSASTSGFLSLYIGGTLKETLTGDNDGAEVDRIDIGAAASVDSTTRGVMYFDHIQWEAWTDTSADVQRSPNSHISGGIRGEGPNFRIAPPGRYTFSLNNSEINANATESYYSPGHGSALAGFEIGAKVRQSITYDGVTEYLFVGKIENIDPDAGQYGPRQTHVTCIDYMGELRLHKLSNIAVQENKRADQLIDTIIDNMPVQPTNTNYATGPDILPVALHDVKDEKTTALNALAKVLKSGVGYLFTRSDSNGGDVLTYQSRHTRAIGSTSQVTLDNSMLGLTVTRNMRRIKNDIYVTVQPAKIDAAATTVLYRLDAEQSIAPGGTFFIEARYTDPNSEAGTRIGGKDIVEPMAADTQYKFSSVEGNNGNDLNASLGIKLTKGGNGSLAQLTNNAAATGYLNKFELLGKGIYIPNKVTLNSTDTDSINTYKRKSQLFYTAPYQNSINVGQDMADNFKGNYKDATNEVKPVKFNANRNATLMEAARDLGVGDLITVIETVTGISDDYFINGVDYEFLGNGIINVSWILEPKGVSDVFILDDAVFGKLDTSKLGF